MDFDFDLAICCLVFSNSIIFIHCLDWILNDHCDSEKYQNNKKTNTLHEITLEIRDTHYEI